MIIEPSERTDDSPRIREATFLKRRLRRQYVELFITLFYMPGFMIGMMIALPLKNAWGLAVGFGLSLVLATAAVIWKRRRDKRQGFEVHLDADRRIADDLPCSQCRYNLHGLRETDDCPECGLTIHRSIYAAELAAAPKPTMTRWLATRIYIAAMVAGIPTFYLLMFTPTAAFVGFIAIFGMVFALTFLIKDGTEAF